MKNTKIVLVEKKEKEESWKFEVEVRSGEGETRSFITTVSKTHHTALTGGRASPEELVKASFAFLLEREGPESILTKFDVSDITTYFPEYEKAMREHFAD